MVWPQLYSDNAFKEADVLVSAGVRARLSEISTFLHYSL
jgi:hypothetical protein